MLYKNLKSILILLSLLQIFSLISMNNFDAEEYLGEIFNSNYHNQPIVNSTDAREAEVLITKEEKMRIVEQSGCLIHQLTACACGKNFENYDQLTAHVRKDHSIKDEEYHCLEKNYYSSLRTYYICPSCEIPPNANINKMCDHYIQHTGQTCIYQCPFCSKKYHIRNSLSVHLERLHGLVMSESRRKKTTNSQSSIKIGTILGLKLDVDDVLKSLNNRL